MIKPTVGRVVLYHPAFEPDSGTNEKTFAAIVCYVWSDTLVNLAVFDENGVSFSQTSVPLFQGEGERPAQSYCEWMAYQKAVASGETAPTLHV